MAEESKLSSSSVDWDTTKQSFIPNDFPRKVTRAWERVPVVAQAPRLHGSILWKKVEAKKYATSKDVEAEVLREVEANGMGPRKRIRGMESRMCIQDATWANIPNQTSPYLESLLSFIPIDFEDTRLMIEEEKGTFPAIHFIPRKRTYNNQIIPPKKAETTDITEKVRQLLQTEVVYGLEEKPTRRRKSARMSMANRRVTLGGPDLGLGSPLKSTPLKSAPVRIFESGGDASGGTSWAILGLNSASRSTRRTTVGSTNELATPSKGLVRRGVRTALIGGRKSMSVLQDAKALKFSGAGKMGVGEERNAEAPLGVEIGMDKSPKRKRSFSIQSATRKSTRLSMRERSSTPSTTEERNYSDADITVLPENEPQEALATLGASSNSSDNHSRETLSADDISASIEMKRQAIHITEAPDIFGTSQSGIEEFSNFEHAERPTNESVRPPTRRSSRESAQETQNSTSKVNILISIKSVHMANISSGIKTHEFRGYKLPEATEYLWLYETAPKQCITHVAKIGQSKAPGEIDDQGLGNSNFNAGRDKPQHAYEILQLYELKDELSLGAILAKQYARGPPQKYSFASRKMLSDISLFEDASLILNRMPQLSIKSAEEAISLPQLSDATESVDIFSPDVPTAEAGLLCDDNGEKPTILTRLDRIKEEEEEEEEEEEVVSDGDTREASDYVPPEQKASLRLRSPPPIYQDLLDIGGKNSARRLSPNKNQESKLSELSPIQFGNKLLEEENIVFSPVEESGFPSSQALKESSTDPIENSPNPFVPPPHEDTIMLKNFVTRVKAKKAASVQNTAKSTEERLQSPLRLPLGYKDSNLSPLPQESSSLKIASHISLSVETPSVSKSSRAVKRSNPLSTPYEGEPPIRRSGRTRTPVKGSATSSLPLPISAPSSIPLRRLGGNNDGISDAAFAIKQKLDKELAALTRINTKKNAGSYSVSAFLSRQAADAGPTTTTSSTISSNKLSKRSPLPFKTLTEEAISEKSPAGNTKDKSAKRKSVVWSEELLQYQDPPSMEERTMAILSDVKKPVKVGMRSASASKIAIGMGISGPAAQNLIPDLVPTTSGILSGKNVVIGLGSGAAGSSNAANTTLPDSNVGVPKMEKARRKSIPVPQKEQTDKPFKNKLNLSSSRIVTPNPKSKAAGTGLGKSSVAVSRGVNGTPAPKRKIRVKA